MDGTYRIAVYATRLTVNLPKSVGPVDIYAEPSEGGVLVTLKATPHGKFKGSAVNDRWAYTTIDPGHQKLPRFGMTNAELRKGLSEDGVLQLWAPAGRKVEERARRLRVPKEPTPEPQPTASLCDLGDLVRQVNAVKDRLGDDLVLEVTDAGRLRALVEYG